MALFFRWRPKLLYNINSFVLDEQQLWAHPFVLYRQGCL